MPIATACRRKRSGAQGLMPHDQPAGRHRHATARHRLHRDAERRRMRLARTAESTPSAPTRTSAVTSPESVCAGMRAPSRVNDRSPAGSGGKVKQRCRLQFHSQRSVGADSTLPTQSIAQHRVDPSTRPCGASQGSVDVIHAPDGSHCADECPVGEDRTVLLNTTVSFHARLLRCAFAGLA